MIRQAFLPAVAIFTAGAAGELLGYGLGAGRARAGLFAFDHDRDGAFTAGDLAAAGAEKQL